VVALAEEMGGAGGAGGGSAENPVHPASALAFLPRPGCGAVLAGTGRSRDTGWSVVGNRPDGCGVRVHTIPESVATSTAATRSWTAHGPLVLLVVNYLRLLTAASRI
jgi:hypothetical protein